MSCIWYNVLNNPPVTYNDRAFVITVETYRLIGRKQEFLYDIINLCKKYDLLEEKLEAYLLLDENKPYDEDITYSIAECYRLIGNVDDMEKWYKKVIEINPKHSAVVYLRMGDAMSFMSDSPEYIKRGVEYLEMALKIDNKNTDILDSLIKACDRIDTQEYETKLKKYCELYLNINPDNIDIRDYLDDLLDR